MIYLRRQKPDLLVFTKWDRFSRNSIHAHQMIGTLRKLGIDPQAIEQPLDLTVPENKLMLAFYLTTPEIENDGRGVNIQIRQIAKRIVQSSYLEDFLILRTAYGLSMGLSQIFENTRERSSD